MPNRIPHGTTTGYGYHNCRCDECRRAVREYKRDRKAALDAGLDWGRTRKSPSGEICTFEGCERTCRVMEPVALCSAHYIQSWKGRPLTPIRPVRHIADGMKRCNRCEEVKPLAAFNRQRNGVQSSCKRCTAISSRSYRYRVSFDEVAALLASPCAGCGTAEALRIDHDHDTGRVRGVLCHNCNVVLTKHMSPTILRRLADYLEAT